MTTLIFMAGVLTGAIIAISVMALLAIAKQAETDKHWEEVDKHG